MSYYASAALPWTVSEEDEQRFRTILRRLLPGGSALDRQRLFGCGGTTAAATAATASPAAAR